MEMKTCSLCKEERPLTSFYKRKTRYDSWCRDCYSKNTIRWQRVYTDKYNEKSKRWRKANPGKKNADTRKRQADKIKATPQWLTENHKEEIENIYIEAKRLEQLDGIKRHVDHIIPLRGAGVCGMHVPWNLQILTAEENMKKSNSSL